MKREVKEKIQSLAASALNEVVRMAQEEKENAKEAYEWFLDISNFMQTIIAFPEPPKDDEDNGKNLNEPNEKQED